MTAVEIRNISKSYEEIKALDDISFDVNQGEIFGLIGPDGSGKTSLFRILTTLLLPNTGTATIMGYDVVSDFKKIRQIIGYMPGRFSLYQDLTVEENMSFYATVFGTTINENYDLVKDIYQHIEPFRTRRAGKLSGGMKQKLALSCALIHKPEVLMLDEPTTGVDAVSRKEFWDMLLGLKEKGITIMVSTPYMDEAGKCDRVGLIQEGRMMSIDTPGMIRESFEFELYAVRSDDMYRLIKDLESSSLVRSVFLFGHYVHVTLQAGDKADKGLLNFLENRDHRNITIKKIPPEIEDCFMELMTKEN